MKRLLLVCAVSMAMFVTGESLICINCRVGIAGRCLFRSTVNCSDSQPNCYSGDLASNISSLMSLQTQGCLDSFFCNQTESRTLLTAGYTVTRTCCATDLCNGASSIHFPLTAALGTILMAVWSNFSL